MVHCYSTRRLSWNRFRMPILFASTFVTIGCLGALEGNAIQQTPQPIDDGQAVAVNPSDTIDLDRNSQTSRLPSSSGIAGQDDTDGAATSAPFRAPLVTHLGSTPTSAPATPENSSKDHSPDLLSSSPQTTNNVGLAADRAPPPDIQSSVQQAMSNAQHALTVAQHCLTYVNFVVSILVSLLALLFGALSVYQFFTARKLRSQVNELVGQQRESIQSTTNRIDQVHRDALAGLGQQEHRITDAIRDQRNTLDRSNATIRHALNQSSRRAEQALEDLQYRFAQYTGKQRRSLSASIAQQESRIAKIQQDVTVGLAHAEAIAPMLIVGTDLALLDLPDITYTHQIPIAVVRTLRFVEQIFTEHDSKEVLWRTLRRSRNGARICYARALCRLALYPDDRDRIVGATPHVGLAAISLLEHAYQRSEADVELGRDVLIRLLQAHRQINDYEGARRIANRLARHGQMNSDQDADVYSKWGNALANLQQGLSSKHPARITCFLNAAEQMEDAYDCVIGWKKVDGSRARTHFSPRTPANLAYYTAKAFWATRCAFPRDPGEFINRLGEDQAKRHVAHLRESIDWALALFFQERQRYGADPFVATIYNYCVALILVVRKSLPDVEVPFLPPKNPELFPQAAAYDDAGWNGMWRKQLNESIDDARAGIAALKSMVPNARLLSHIYVEHAEGFATLREFERGLRFLELARDDDQTVFRFYSTGDWEKPRK